MKISIGEKVFLVCNNIFLFLLALVCLIPILNIFAKSLSGVSAVAGGKVWIWPIDFNLDGWMFVLQKTAFPTSLTNSLIITTIGTLLALIFTTLTAYTLSKQHIKGRAFIAYIYVFAMIFNAGILPMYFQLKSYGLLNTLWVLIIPSIINPFYMFVLKTGFENMPESLEEAAKIDGASIFRTLISIVIPVSKASLATIAIFYAVNYWNKYYDALMFITNPNLKPVTLFLYELIKLSNAPVESLGDIEIASNISPEIMNSSAVVLTVLPILLIYPFMQKYFVKGVTIGSVKG